MSTLLESAEEFINVEGLKAYIKALEIELAVMKSLHDHLSFQSGGAKPAKGKKSVLSFLSKNGRGKALEIAQLSGLKVTRVKKASGVRQAKRRR